MLKQAESSLGYKHTRSRKENQIKIKKDLKKW